MDFEKDIENCIRVQGLNKTLKICVEEPAELIKAITKIWRTTTTPNKVKTLYPDLHHNLLEEMVDVFIILHMLSKIYGITEDEFKEMLDKKMQRNTERLKEV